MSMDSILSRFSNFNTEMGKRHSLNSNDDDEEEEDEDEEESKHQQDEDDKDAIMRERDNEYDNGDNKASGAVVAVAQAVEEKPLVREYVDNNYWKVDIYNEKSVEELMAEMSL